MSIKCWRKNESKKVGREPYFSGHVSILGRSGWFGRSPGSFCHPLGSWWSLLVLFCKSFLDNLHTRTLPFRHPNAQKAPADNRTHPPWKIFIDATNYWCAEHSPRYHHPSKPLLFIRWFQDCCISIFGLVSIDVLACFIRCDFESTLCSFLHAFGRTLIGLVVLSHHTFYSRGRRHEAWGFNYRFCLYILVLYYISRYIYINIRRFITSLI